MITNKQTSINKWRIKNKRFREPIDIEPIDERYKLFRLQEECIYYTIAGEKVIAEVGFITDGYSIPRVFRGIVGSSMQAHSHCAFIHDKLYKSGKLINKAGDLVKCTRKRADDIFLEAMWLCEIFWLKRRGMWLAVRVWSWIPWRKYRKEEKRETVLPNSTPPTV